MSSRGNLDHSGMRWALGGLTFTFFPHTPDAKHGYEYSTELDAIAPIDGYLGVNEAGDLARRTGFGRYKKIEVDDSVSPDVNYFCKRTKHNSPGKLTGYGNQSAIQWTYDDVNNKWTTGRDVFTWWHSPFGDLCLGPSATMDIRYNATYIPRFRAESSYMPYVNMGDANILLDQFSFYDQQLCYYKGEDYNDGRLGQYVMGSTIYRNGEYVYKISDKDLVISGVYVIDKDNIILAVVEKFLKLLFYKITYNKESEEWIANIVSDGYAYVATTELGRDYYYILNMANPDQDEFRPPLYCGLISPVRFSQDGSECSFIHHCFNDEVNMYPTYEGGADSERTINNHFARTVTIALSINDEFNVVSSVTTADYYKTIPLIWDNDVTDFLYDMSYYDNAEIPIAINYRDNQKVIAYAKYGIQSGKYLIQLSAAQYKLRIESIVLDGETISLAEGSAAYMYYDLVYLDIISKTRLLFLQSTAEGTAGNYFKVNNEVVSPTEFEIPYATGYDYPPGFGGMVEHRKIEKLKAGESVPYLFNLTYYGYEGFPNDGENPNTIPEVSRLNAIITNIAQVKTEVIAYGYTANTIMYPIGLT